MSDEDEAVRKAARTGSAAAAAAAAAAAVVGLLLLPLWGLVMLLSGNRRESGAIILSWDLVAAFALFKEGFDEEGMVVVILLLVAPLAAVLVGAVEGIFDDEAVVSTPLERADIGIAVSTLATHRCFALDALRGRVRWAFDVSKL